MKIIHCEPDSLCKNPELVTDSLIHSNWSYSSHRNVWNISDRVVSAKNPNLLLDIFQSQTSSLPYTVYKFNQKITIFWLDQSQYLLDRTSFYWICLTVLHISRRLGSDILILIGDCFVGNKFFFSEMQKSRSLRWAGKVTQMKKCSKFSTLEDNQKHKLSRLR